MPSHDAKIIAKGRSGMILGHVHGENVLSFGSGPAALDLDLGPGLTIFVGPNGGGKSSLLRTIELGLDVFANYRRPRPFLPQSLAHRPMKPTERMRVVCDVTWDSPEEQALWRAFLIGCLAPREDWNFASPLYENAESHFSFNNDHFLGYLTAISSLDFSEAVQDLREQQLCAIVDPRSGRVEMACTPRRLGGVYEITRGDYWHPDVFPHRRSQVSLAELYVRSLDLDARVAWSDFWSGSGSLPDLPSFSWRCLTLLRDGETVNMVPLSGSNSVEVDWPEAIWPLFRVHPNLDAPSLHWGDILATLLQAGFTRWDDWHVSDPAEWRPGLTVLEALRAGRIGAGLMALQGTGHDGHASYDHIRDQFRQLTGRSLSYRILPSSPLTAKDVEMAKHRIEYQTNGMAVAVVNDPIRDVSVQAVLDDDTPILLGGSGRVQLATLLTLFELASTVLALDEPEQALHPTLQTQLVRQWASARSQTLLVTHSPYLVPPGHLDRVRYVALDETTGCSKVSAPQIASLTGDSDVHRTSGDTQPNEARPVNASTLARYVRWAGDATWLFARLVVLVEGPADDAAVSTWFDKWLARVPGLRRDAQSFGILFMPAGGKKAIMPLARILDGFSIPWVALFDADCLAKDGEVARDRSDGNQVVWEMWDSAGFVGADPRAMADLGWVDRRQLFPLSREGMGPQIYLRGEQPFDNLDTLPPIIAKRDEALQIVDHGPNMYRWIAENADAPDEFGAMFRSILDQARALEDPRAKGDM